MFLAIFSERLSIPPLVKLSQIVVFHELFLETMLFGHIDTLQSHTVVEEVLQQATFQMMSCHQLMEDLGVLMDLGMHSMWIIPIPPPNNGIVTGVNMLNHLVG